MLTTLFVTLILIGGLALLGPVRAGRQRRHALITEHPYNNRYSDATAARDMRY
jgi:hypothetical protein